MSHTRSPLPILHSLCLVLLAGTLAAHGAPVAAVTASNRAEPWDGPPFTAKPAAIARAAARIESDEGDDVVVLLADASYSYDAAGRETYSQRLVYKILTPSAHESWSTVEGSWAPWHQARPEIRARVITPDGAEHLLDPATMTENADSQDSPDMFEDGRVLRAPLPATQPGAVVEQQVIVRDQTPFFDGGVVRLHGLDLGMPVLRSRLVLETPADMPLRWLVRELPEARKKETVAGGRRQVEIEVRDLEPGDDPEPGLPSDAPRTAYVAFSTGRSWGDLARRYSALVDQTIRGADLAAFLRSATAGVKGEAPSQLDLINLYLARLGAEVRYTGIELGEGGMVPRKPAETLRRRFGDCKDKAVLLTAMLRASDIPAYVALLSAGEDEADVEETLPGFGTFNHAIVVVPGTPALWIDPTDPYARAGELPLADEGRLALIASPTADSLTRTPESTSADNREVETREFLLADLGPSRIVETTDFYGAPERALRAFYSQQADDAVRKALKDYATSFYLADDVASLEHSKPNDLTVPLRMRMEVKNARRGFTDARNAAVGVNPASLLTRLPADLTRGANAAKAKEASPEPRQSDYVFREPLQLEVRYRLVPPAGYVPQTLPATRTRRFGTIALAESYAAGPDNVVTANFRLDTGKRRITAQEYEEVRKGVHEALQEKTTLLMFDQAGEAQLDAGRVREALQELERLAALSPQKALPRSRVARALLAGGMGEAARREARKATQLEPKLAEAWHTLGWVLQHDELGRRLRPGYDRAGALAAYRKARELDPHEDTTRADLAILLEYDARGRRYSPQADLPAAIAEYQALRKDLNDHSMDDNLLVALVRSSRFEEARKLAAEMKDSQTGAVLALVATAATEGPEAAVAEGERRFTDEKARAAALQQAGQNLLLVRRYADAAVLFDRAGRQSANPAALLSLADLVRRARRHEEIQLPPDQPSTVFKRLLLALFTGDLETVKPSAYFSHDIQAELAREKGSDQLIRRMFSQMRDSMAGDVPPDAALDLGLTALRETVAGDDEIGYRINFTSLMGETSRQFAVYVVKEGGEYRLVGANASTQLLAQEVLRRLGRGDLRGARQWLDWAAEDAHGPERTGGDPLPPVPFAALWAKGSQGGAEAMRCAAAALLGGESAQASPLLAACREAETEPARRNVLDFALALSYESQERPQEMEKVSHRLLEALPDSERAEAVHTSALIDLERWDEVRAHAEQRLQRTPGDGTALRLLARDALHAKDFDRAEQRLNQIVDSGKATANDFNELAWMRLEIGRVDDKTVELSQRATSLSSYANAADLHTQAAVYAEMGKTAEAYRLILQSLAARGDEAPASDDWYVFGRLAEQYGLPDVAREYYKRVTPPTDKQSEALSTHALATRRLGVLGDTAKLTKTAKRAK